MFRSLPDVFREGGDAAGAKLFDGEPPARSWRKAESRFEPSKLLSVASGLEVDEGCGSYVKEQAAP